MIEYFFLLVEKMLSVYAYFSNLKFSWWLELHACAFSQISHLRKWPHKSRLRPAVAVL